MLTEYVGFDKDDIKMIKKMKTRWCCIYKNYPQVVMTEKDIWILADQDETPSGSEYSDSDTDA
jgi:hypothetical protein